MGSTSAMDRYPSASECPATQRSSTAPVICIVDDDLDVLGSLRFLLETDGFDVRTFRSGAALLDAIGAGAVDCLVIDYKMPAMSGLELASRLRNRDIDTPIILITGYPDDNIEKKAAAAGIRRVVLKPLLEDSLVSRVREVIRESQAACR
jgi:two-component system, LuxR family, response regulator FixJ